MNKNIEDIIKEALDNHDAGYVTGAWEKMNARLDGTPSTPFYKKWWMAAALGTVLVGSAVYFVSIGDSEKSTTETNTIAKTEATTDNTSSEVKAAQLKQDNSVSSNSENIETKEDLVSSNTTTEAIHNNNASEINEPVGTYNPIVSHPKTTNLNNNHPNNDNSKVEEQILAVEYKILDLPTSVCLNEKVSIHNSNEKLSIVVIDASGKKTIITGGKTVDFKASKAGNFTVISGSKQETITVNENRTSLYVDVDPSLLYENGIPSIKFKVPGLKDDLTWSSNVKGAELKGDTYIAHPYTEKEVVVTVSHTDEMGCTVSEKQVVEIKEDYNLLAPTGFEPTSAIPEKVTFMPYALMKRTDLQFVLTVIDPRTGATVFSTKDATQGWTGVDIRTGEMVKENSVWIWKVNIKNPNAGEPAEYKGTITRM